MRSFPSCWEPKILTSKDASGRRSTQETAKRETWLGWLTTGVEEEEAARGAAGAAMWDPRGSDAPACRAGKFPLLFGFFLFLCIQIWEEASFGSLLVH